MQTSVHPKFYCKPCGGSLKALRNQCLGRKELAVYLKNLQRDNLDEFRLKVRSCRLIEPEAPDGTVGLRSVADRAKVIAQMHEDYVIAVQVSDNQNLLWPKREEYGTMMFQNGDAPTKAEGMVMFGAKLREVGALKRIMNGVQRIGVPGVPFTQGTNVRSKKRSLGITAGIASGGALAVAKNRMNFNNMGVDFASPTFGDVSAGAFIAMAQGSVGDAAAHGVSLDRPSGSLEASDVTVDTIFNSSLTPALEAPEGVMGSVAAEGAAETGGTAGTRLAELRTGPGLTLFCCLLRPIAQAHV